MENDKSSQEIRSIASPGQEWHIEGYIPPKTCLFLSKKWTISKERRKGFAEELIKTTKDSDPAKQEPFESSTKKFWLKKSGSFSKQKRETFTANIMKKSRSTPGPGAYINEKDHKKVISCSFR